MAMTGGCLCGAARYESTAPALFGGHCYCADCRKTSSSHSAALAVPRAALQISGDLKVYASPAASGVMVERAFCPTCGTHLYSGGVSRPDVVMLRAGTLDDPEQFKPMAAIFVSRAPSWDAPAPGLMTFPEMPPSANTSAEV